MKNLGKIRVVEINKEPWFIAPLDICKALDLKNPTEAIQRLDEDERSKFNIGASRRNKYCKRIWVLYNLILSSRKPEAKSLKDGLHMK